MAAKGQTAYGETLSLIHDDGFGNVAREAAKVVGAEIRKRPLGSDIVVDLGCGSGILAQEMVKDGFNIVGYDQSPAMIKMCRSRAPQGTFKCESFLEADLPTAAAVTAIGEVFSYLFDTRNSWAQLRRLLRKIHRALVPGGVLLFDVVTPGRAPAPDGIRNFREGEDWACLFSQVEEAKTGILRRVITTFRKSGRSYRREHETHRLHLLEKARVVEELRSLGFRVRTLRGYGAFAFPVGVVGFLCRKT